MHLLGGHLDVEVRKVTEDLELHLATGRLCHCDRELRERADVFAVDGEHAITLEELALGRVPRDDHTDRWRDEEAVRGENGEIEQHGEDEVHHWAGDDDEDTFPDRLGFERSPAVLRQHRFAPRLFEHRDEPTERKYADAVLGFLAAEPDDLRAETDAEREHLDAEELGHGEMAELVHEDEHADEDDEVEEIHTASPVSTGEPPVLASRHA